MSSLQKTSSHPTLSSSDVVWVSQWPGGACEHVSECAEAGKAELCTESKDKERQDLFYACQDLSSIWREYGEFCPQASNMVVPADPKVLIQTRLIVWFTWAEIQNRIERASKECARSQNPAECLQQKKNPLPPDDGSLTSKLLRFFSPHPVDQPTEKDCQQMFLQQSPPPSPWEASLRRFFNWLERVR